MRSLVVCYGIASGLLAGCVKAELVECGDGRSCPIGTVCDVERATCIDPRGLSVPLSAIEFSNVACDGSITYDLPLRNYGLSPIDFSASTLVNGVTVAPASGQIAPGETVQLTLTAKPGGSLPGVPVEGTLLVTTDYEIIERPIRLTSLGGLITVDATVDFGEALVAATESRPFTIVNKGNEAVDVALALPAPFTASIANPLRVEPASQRSIDLRFRPPSVAAFGGDASLSYNGRVCQPPAQSVALTGIGTGAPLLASQTLIDFGSTACGVERTQRLLTLSSNLADEQTLTTVLSGPNSADYGVSGGESLVGPGSTETITVTREAIPTTTALGVKTGTLTVTASPEGAVKVISITHQVSAPVLTSGSNEINFGNVLAGASASITIYISNTGDRTASVAAEIMKGAGNSEITVNPNPLQVHAGDNMPVVIQIKGGEKGEVVDAVVVFQAKGQCSSAPRIAIRAAII